MYSPYDKSKLITTNTEHLQIAVIGKNNKNVVLIMNRKGDASWRRTFVDRR